MDPQNLPEEMTYWPEDGFELLGVKPGSSETEIKRAYNRLIRRFKPEHHPDQFRRIRTCYEECLTRSMWYRSDPEPEPVESEPAKSEISLNQIDFQASSQPSEPVHDVDRSWELACSGDLANAYMQLEAQTRTYPEREDIPLRLYWLLKLDARLDPSRSYHAWLAEALRVSRFTGSSLELLRREFRLAVEISKTIPDEYTRLTQIDAGASELNTIAESLIIAASELNSYELVQSVLNDCRKTLTCHDEQFWLNLLVTTFTYVIWDCPMNLDIYIRGELRQLKHLELSHAWYFDRFEETHDFYRSLGRYSQIGWVKRFLRSAWPSRGYLSDSVAKDTSLSILGSTLFDSSSNHLNLNDVALFQFLELSLMRHLRMCDDYRESATEEYVRGLLRDKVYGNRAYSATRPLIIELAKEESLFPDELIAACDGDSFQSMQSIGTSLKLDIGVRLICLANLIVTR